MSSNVADFNNLLSPGLQLRYKEDLLWLRGLGCFMYDTPEMVTLRNITKFKVGIILLSFPSPRVVRNLSLYFVPCSFGMFFFVTVPWVSLQNNYPVEAKKNHSKFSVVLDTPEYNRVTELKSHMSMVSPTSNTSLLTIHVKMSRSNVSRSCQGHVKVKIHVTCLKTKYLAYLFADPLSISR